MLEDLIWTTVWTGVLLIVPAWQIFGRAGFSSKLSLVIFVPAIGPLFALFWLAFARWPAEETAGTGAG